jgi:hypothetical protein
VRLEPEQEQLFLEMAETTLAVSLQTEARTSTQGLAAARDRLGA